MQRTAVVRWLGRSTPHRVLTQSDIAALAQLPLKHHTPTRISDHVCIHAVRAARWVVDRFVREKHGHRAVVGLYVAHVPAAAATHRAAIDAVRFGAPSAHVELLDPEQPRSVRSMGALHENRVAHLATVAELVPLTPPERWTLAVATAVLRCAWYLLFAVRPRIGHRLAGYVAEEAAVLATHMVNDIDVGKVENKPAPKAARCYWHLRLYGADPAVGVAGSDGDAAGPGAGGQGSSVVEPTPQATLREVMVLVRADELRHAETHHAAAGALELDATPTGFS